MTSWMGSWFRQVEIAASREDAADRRCQTRGGVWTPATGYRLVEAREMP